jgi:predicted ArsR family transcriptional regulator
MEAAKKQKTRARVIDLLRRKRRTVDELAGELGLTDNAVRIHLAALEAENIVCQEGVRRSGLAGKPAVIYGIVSEAEPSFSQVYAPVLASLVDTLAERLSPDELEEVLRLVGRRLAASQIAPTGPLGKRVRSVSSLLNKLGSLTTVESNNGTAVLRGASCPLSVAVSRRSEVCLAVEEMLAVLTGARVTRQCDYGDRPACCFILSEGA